MAREVLGVAGAIIGSSFGPVGAQIGFAIGSTLGTLIDPPYVDGPALADAGLQTSRDGVPIPIGWGITHVVGNIIQINPIVESTKKTGGKKGGVKENVAKRTFAIGIARSIEGPIGGLVRVWENNKLVYDVRGGTTFPAEDNTAFEAATTLYLGTEDQLPDSELESHTGVGSTPAYRGLAYCVWNNKDITNFGSSIPSYRFEIWVSNVYVPESSAFGANSGYALTQGHVRYTASPIFPHPFANQIYPEYTFSVIVKNVIGLEQGQRMHVADIQASGSSTGTISLARRSGGDQVFFNFSLEGAGKVTIASDTIEGIDGSGWSQQHWYWVGFSYSQTLNVCKFHVTNLTINAEKTEVITINNNINVEFPPATDICGWGGGSAPHPSWLKPLLHWQGYLSQMYIHNEYVDLDVESNRRKFANLDGAKKIITGKEITGTTPLVYLPNGLPSSNVGSINIGTYPTDFWLYGVETEGETPPVSANP